MLEKSFGLFFYLKKARNQKNEKRHVYLRITVNGCHRELSLKRQWTITQWDSSLGRATGESEDAKELNSYLKLISCKVYQAKIKLIENNKPITSDGIKAVLLGEDEKKYFIMIAFLEHNVQMQALVGVEVAAGTMTRYKTTYAHVRDFIRWKYRVDDMEALKEDELAEAVLSILKIANKCPKFLFFQNVVDPEKNRKYEQFKIILHKPELIIEENRIIKYNNYRHSTFKPSIQKVRFEVIKF